MTDSVEQELFNTNRNTNRNLDLLESCHVEPDFMKSSTLMNLRETSQTATSIGR
jgi:hypothetical protein